MMKFTLTAESARKPGALALQQNGGGEANSQDDLDDVYNHFISKNLAFLRFIKSIYYIHEVCRRFDLDGSNKGNNSQ